MPIPAPPPPHDASNLLGSLRPPRDARELAVLRRQVAAVRAASQRAGAFRGFRALTVGASALAAVLTAWATPLPYDFVVGGVPIRYDLEAWVVVAGLCLAAGGGEMLWRAKGSPYGLAMLRTAAGQFLPCVAAGAAVTFVIDVFRPDLRPSLPGLWALLFGLGVCSCARLLPRAFWAVGRGIWRRAPSGWRHRGRGRRRGSSARPSALGRPSPRGCCTPWWNAPNASPAVPKAGATPTT
ncbi:hypothetical protein [Alienimonas californiensis]|uniref:Uncharacterized protein n=1 Tax=Alienimonas californiensis TaxID=2527989 RepID=A0A517P7W1_9PLAN|nr:hypothetical protein [Alienimonas californiensis]QDT15453.1 hypothetical protein CA12_15380 [Alienimonas californiensis]